MGTQRRDEWPNLDNQATGDATPGGGKPDIAGEFQELGQRLAATARALWQSEQRQELQQEVTDGLRMLREQLSSAADTVRANPKVQSLKGQVEQKVEAGRTSDTFEDVRAGLTGGLRMLNEQLQRFTERLEQRDAPAADAPPATAAAPIEADVVSSQPLATAESVAPKHDLPGAPEGPAAESPR